MKMEQARLDDNGIVGPGPAGMKIDVIADEEDVKEEEEADTVIVKPHSVQKKTKIQRNKEAKLLLEASSPPSLKCP